MAFNDYFSEHSRVYAEARPDYPEELFEYLAAQCERHELAWDCATGNGQAAASLARIFERVIATDGSADQLQLAQVVPNIEYRTLLAGTNLAESNSCDLVTVAQALHWFANDEFFSSVKNALKPDGVFAAWCYGVQKVEQPIDGIVTRLYEDILGPYWPEERRLVENRYRDIDFPFETSVQEDLALTRDWNLAQFGSYVTSWSALQRYKRAQGSNPLALIWDELSEAWGDDGEATRRIEWPLTVVTGRM